VPTGSVVSNPLTPLNRRERAIQAELQLLLDAQSAGLIQGRISDQHGDDKSSDAGSSTPTTRSIVRSPSREPSESNRSRTRRVIPVRQPRKKKISLNSARKGILCAIEELSDVKTFEMRIMDEEMYKLQHLLEQVSSWEKKITRFEREMKKITEGAEGREIVELKTEKSAIETEIRELEERLLGLRARERHLARRIEEVENRKEADMSSFREGKREAEDEVKDFLRRPPLLEVTATVLTSSGQEGVNGRENFMALPYKRRTLEMAKDYFSTSLSTITMHRASITTEREALDQGAQIWTQAVSLVTSFEQALRGQMSTGKQPSVQDLEVQARDMDEIVKDLEGKSKEAEMKGWNLLICAIGAELEAFKEGRELLRGLLETLDPGYMSRRETENHMADGEGLIGEETFVTAKSQQSVHSMGDGNLRNGNGTGKDLHTEQAEHDHQDSQDSQEDPGHAFLDNPDSQDSQNDPGHTFLTRSSFGDIAGVGVRQELNHSGHQTSGMGVGSNWESRPRVFRRESSSYRSESEDDGPPATLLVGVQDEDDG
jgi:hypothetical protein